MGSGKSTLGKKLAKLLEVEFVDTDKLVSKEFGPIPAIFEEKGESFFRDLETSALRKALTGEAVVATGGGVVLREINRELLKAHNVIFLDSTSKHVLPTMPKCLVGPVRKLFVWVIQQAVCWSQISCNGQY